MAIMWRTGWHLGALTMTILALVSTGCLPAGGADSEPRERDAAAYKHGSLLAGPATSELSERTQSEAMAELARLPGGYDMSSLPVVYDKDGSVRVGEQLAVKGGAEQNLNASTRSIFTVGGIDLITYFFIEIPLPSFVTDADGGTIRLILQHEVDGLDQVRVIDEHIGTEFDNDAFGRRGRFPGRYGWTRQGGGGEWAWILGDGTPHNLATPWDWAWIVDYRFLQDNSVLGGDTIRIYSHPHVTTRVVFMD